MTISTVPLPFAASLLAGIVAVRVILVTRKVGWPNGLISLFFALLAVQAILTGFRFGHSLEFIRLIQPISAMLVCPLAYLAFRRLRGPGNDGMAKSNIWHIFPAVVTAVIVWFNIDIPLPVDSIIWVSFLVYSVLFYREIQEGPDSLERFGTSDAQAIVSARIVTLYLFIIIMVFDVLLFLNFQYWSAVYTEDIVAMGSLLLIAMSVAMLILPSEFPIPVVVDWLQKSSRTDQSATTEDHQTFNDLETLMRSKKPYLDPNINITRISRQLSLSARMVSNAVNRVRGQNFSQYINRFRVQDACVLLESTDMSVTDIMFTAGFQTKSTFNREFLSITGKSPTTYRKENPKQEI